MQVQMVCLPFGQLISMCCEIGMLFCFIKEGMKNLCSMALMDIAMEPAEGHSQPSGHLMCFQLGSRMLGITNDEDAGKGQAYFDVFALADLETLAVKEVEAEEETKPKNGKRFRVEHTTNQLAKTPKSFTSNSPKEQRMSAYLADVSASFTELYRHRRPLYLNPSNECGMPKFVCTTVCSALFPLTQLRCK
jgi:hypothetical protein